MAQAATRAGRSPESVGLVAVTKRRPLEDIKELIGLGQGLFGENRVDEFCEKEAALASLPEDKRPCWHFIGHLQRNKAKHLMGKTGLIHGVENPKLLDELQKRAQGLDSPVAFLLEVNVAGEASKYGISPEAVEGLLQRMGDYPALDCRGLMTMAPFDQDPESARPVFRKLRELRDNMNERFPHLRLETLSMGMTQDFEVAIEEGATLVRVGTALFV